MGVVFEAEDIKLGRHVALKFLPEQLAQNPVALDRFQLEARTASALNHPNICTIFEIEEANGQPFLAMELLQGEVLSEKIKGKGLDLDSVLDLCTQIASALEAAHRKGIIHRDVKPANIFVTTSGQAKILDFGLAKVNSSVGPAVEADDPTIDEHLTNPGFAVGTVAYMSPEQVAGKELDSRTDVFSFGAVLYEMASGRQAFTGNTSGLIFHSILENRPCSLAKLRPDLPLRLDEIIAKALEKDREVRYQHVADIGADLKRLKRDITPGTSMSPTPAPRRKKHTAALLVCLTVLLLVAAYAIGTYLFSKNSHIASIAVLPFTSSQADPASEDVEESITEGIIDNLSQLPNIKVMSDSSIFRYKASKADPQTIGRNLKVEAVVVGRILKRADGMSVSAELVKVNDATQLWGHRYDASQPNVAAAEQQIVNSISDALRAKLRGTIEHDTRTVDPQAYQFYVRGRHEFGKWTEPGMRNAVEYFQKAVDRAPDYAAAYAGLADAYATLDYFRSMSPGEALSQAHAAAQHALTLDSSLAEAHASESLVDAFDWKFEPALRGYQRALELNPNLAIAHEYYSWCLEAVGKHKEAVAEANRALELDPLSLMDNQWLGFLFYDQHDYDKAIAQWQKSLDIDPNYAPLHEALSEGYAMKRSYDQSVKERQLFLTLEGHSDLATQDGEIYAKSGFDALLKKKIERETDSTNKSSYAPMSAVFDYAMLGDRDKTLLWLERVYAEHGALVLMNSSPELDFLHSDPRYQDLLRRVGFPPQSSFKP